MSNCKHIKSNPQNLCVHCLQAQIERLKSAHRWIPVSEALQEDQDFIACCNIEVPWAGWCEVFNPDFRVEFTHWYPLDDEVWMPLPEPPGGAEE